MVAKDLNKQLKPLCKDYDIVYLAMFGSYARGDQTSKSDLDLLVKFGKKISLWDLIGVEYELSKKIGIKIDLITKGGLNPKIKKYVMDDLKVIYEK